jgi:[NiFe] hydrogenase assembly HybE family chaperone
MSARAPALSADQGARVQALVEAFEHIARTRMRDLPVVNARLMVEAVGFRALGVDEMLGVLVTPWFMSLVWLPRAQVDDERAVGSTRKLQLGALSIELIFAHEAVVGQFASCSLYSPLHEFADQAAVRATAREVMAQLEQQAALAPLAPEPEASRALSRRGFLRLAPHAVEPR